MMPRPRRPLPSFPNPKTAHRKEFYSRDAGRWGGGQPVPEEEGATTISHDARGEGGVGRDAQEGGKQLSGEGGNTTISHDARGERGGAAAMPGERREAAVQAEEAAKRQSAAAVGAGRGRPRCQGRRGEAAGSRGGGCKTTIIRGGGERGGGGHIARGEGRGVNADNGGGGEDVDDRPAENIPRTGYSLADKMERNAKDGKRFVTTLTPLIDGHLSFSSSMMSATTTTTKKTTAMGGGSRRRKRGATLEFRYDASGFPVGYAEAILKDGGGKEEGGEDDDEGGIDEHDYIDDCCGNSLLTNAS